MVQLAVYAADPDSQKQASKKATWPIGVEEFVEVPLPEKEGEMEVAVKPAGCCTTKRAAMYLILFVLVAAVATATVIGVLYATKGPCGLGIEVDGCTEPQTGDALEPPTPTPDYDCDFDGRPGHGGHHDHDHDSRPDDNDDDDDDNHGNFHGRPDDDDNNGGHHGGPDHDGHHDNHHNHGSHEKCHHHGRPHRPHRPGRPFPQDFGMI
jgi:hypothetical protein